MAGSIKDVIYVSDSGKNYIARMDESNAEAAGFDDYTGEEDISPLPRGFQMRYANVIEPTSGAKRRIYVGKTNNGIWTGTIVSVLLFLIGAGTPGNAAFTISSLVGEAARRYKAGDTGLTDGDAT